MKSMYTLATAAAALMAMSSAQAEDMTIVSWGGAYSASQQAAYHDPYMKLNPDVNIINDESSNEAVAKMRAMAEAGNITWDVVDVVAADAIRLCDEGLAIEIDPDKDLAPAPDGTPASEDFGELLVSPCYIPQIVYSTTFAIAPMSPNGAAKSRKTCVPFSTPKPSPANAAWKSARSTTSNGPCCVTVLHQTKSMTCFLPMPVSNRPWPNWRRSVTT